MRRLNEIVVHRFREKASVFLTELHPARGGTALMARIRLQDVLSELRGMACSERMARGARWVDLNERVQNEAEEESARRVQAEAMFRRPSST